MKPFPPGVFDAIPLRALARRRPLTDEQVKDGLRAKLDGTDEGRAAVAASVGLAPGMLSALLRTDRPVSDDVAAAMGLRRVIRFEPID